VTHYLLPTVDILIQDAGSKLLRARVGACGALADVIVGRSWQELGGGGIELDDGRHYGVRYGSSW
jgi:proteasome component ECM29